MTSGSDVVAGGSSEPPYVPALGFRWLTPLYDWVMRATMRERAFKHALIRQAGVEPGHHILDLGCGTGTLSVWMQQEHQQATVTGVDGDPTVLSLATRKAAQFGVPVRFERAMSYDLPYDDASFDRVVSSLLFHHLSRNDKARTAREIQRVLRPGGQLHIADWGKPTGRVMRALFLLIQMLDGFANTEDSVSGALVEILTAEGFSSVLVRGNFSTVFGTMALYGAHKHEPKAMQIGSNT